MSLFLSSPLAVQPQLGRLSPCCYFLVSTSQHEKNNMFFLMDVQRHTSKSLSDAVHFKAVDGEQNLLVIDKAAQFVSMCKEPVRKAVDTTTAYECIPLHCALTLVSCKCIWYHAFNLTTETMYCWNISKLKLNQFGISCQSWLINSRNKVSMWLEVYRAHQIHNPNAPDNACTQRGKSSCFRCFDASCGDMAGLGLSRRLAGCVHCCTRGSKSQNGATWKEVRSKTCEYKTSSSNT